MKIKLAENSQFGMTMVTTREAKNADARYQTQQPKLNLSTAALPSEVSISGSLHVTSFHSMALSSNT
jgi:hypothetical protein